MKNFILPLSLTIASVTALAADKTINDLPANASPSSGTLLEVYDPAATPKSGKYLLSNATRIPGTVVTNATTISPGDLAVFGTSSTNLSAATSAQVQAALGQVYQGTNTVLTHYAGTDTNAILAAVGGSPLPTFTLLSTIDTTNFVLDAGSSAFSYPEIEAANHINLVHCTNGPGSIGLTIYPMGSGRIVSFPTNWIWLSTNNFTLVGTLWSCTVPAGKVGYLGLKKRSNGSDQTNIVANMLFTP